MMGVVGIGGVGSALANDNEPMKKEAQCYKQVKILENNNKKDAFQKCMDELFENTSKVIRVSDSKNKERAVK